MTTKAEREQLDRIEADVTDIRVLLIGDLKTPNQLGALERLRRLEAFVAGMNKIKWLLVGTIVASLGTLIATLVI